MGGNVPHRKQGDGPPAPVGTVSRVLLFLPCLWLAGCDTCVSGLVAPEGPPQEGVRIEALNESGQGVREAWTDPQGRFCLGNLSLGRTILLRIDLDGTRVEEWVYTGDLAGSCLAGTCIPVDLDRMARASGVRPGPPEKPATDVALR